MFHKLVKTIRDMLAKNIREIKKKIDRMIRYGEKNEDTSFIDRFIFVGRSGSSESSRG